MTAREATPSSRSGDRRRTRARISCRPQSRFPAAAVRDRRARAVGFMPHCGRYRQDLRWRSGADGCSAEELSRVTILKTQPAGVSRILRAGADIDASRRIELIALDEDDSKARQRLAAPADRR